jgi:hypothetical protein
MAKRGGLSALTPRGDDDDTILLFLQRFGFGISISFMKMACAQQAPGMFAGITMAMGPHSVWLYGLDRLWRCESFCIYYVESRACLGTSFELRIMHLPQ